MHNILILYIYSTDKTYIDIIKYVFMIVMILSTYNYKPLFIMNLILQKLPTHNVIENQSGCL